MSKKTASVPLSKKTTVILIGYGIVIAGLGLLIQQFDPVVGRVAFMAGLAGGGLCLLWGIAELMGLKVRLGAILTTIALFFVFLTQSVEAWLGPTGEGPIMLFPGLLLTASMLLTAGMFIRVLHSERPPEFNETGSTRRDNTPSGGNKAPSRETSFHLSKFAHWRHGRKSCGAGGGCRGKSSFRVLSPLQNRRGGQSKSEIPRVSLESHRTSFLEAWFDRSLKLNGGLKR